MGTMPDWSKAREELAAVRQRNEELEEALAMAVLQREVAVKDSREVREALTEAEQARDAHRARITQLTEELHSKETAALKVTITPFPSRDGLLLVQVSQNPRTGIPGPHQVGDAEATDRWVQELAHQAFLAGRSFEIDDQR